MNEETFAACLDEYAHLAINVGLEVKPGQTVYLNAPVAAAAFARACSAAAYEAGAREVVVNWSDDAMTRQRYLHAADEVFDEVSAWQKLRLDTYADGGASFLSILCNDPSNLAGVSADRIRRASKTRAKVAERYYARIMNNENPWCIVAVPEENWAKQVYPELSGADAVEALWQRIFETMRITGDGRAAERWQEHLDTMERRAARMTEYGFTALHYTNSLGTDLIVGLPAGHCWAAASGTTPEGLRFVANMPSEEIFSAPDRTRVNGVVYASKPLALNGNIVRDIRFELVDGRIVDAQASTGLDILLAEMDTDEGARYLGEVALVPYDSPISNQGILYLETLFDENASCHLAFGQAYPECFQGGNAMTPEELVAAGLNAISDAHTDFMVGTADLTITGILPEGGEVPVFVNGNFAF